MNPPLRAPRLKLLAPRAVKLGLVPSVQMEILEVWLSGNPRRRDDSCALCWAGCRRSLIVWPNSAAPLLIHNLCVFRQSIYSAPENFCGAQELCALRSRRHARLRAAKPGLSVW